MAKNKKKDKKDGGQAEAVDAIRSAIERGLQISAEGAQATRERTRELVDEIAHAAGRVRQSLEDMRVLDELRRLRTEVEALGARVSALERPGSPASSSRSASAAKPATSTASRSRAKKSTSARKSTAKKSTSTRPRATKATTKPSSSSGSSASS
jgi:hypothetical protein